MNNQEAAALQREYGGAIQKVAHEVANEFAASSGSRGHGWRIVEGREIESEVWVQFLKTGMTVEKLQAMEAPIGFIRSTARLYGANNQARTRRRAALTDFRPLTRDEGGDSFIVFERADERDTENEVVSDALTEAAEAVVEGILARLTSTAQAETMRLFYLEGLQSKEVANRLGVKDVTARQRLYEARKAIGPEADSSLRAWRNFAFPDGITLELTATPVALLEVVS